MRSRPFLLCGVFLLAIYGIAAALDSGDTDQPYEKVLGCEVTFSQLTKRRSGIALHGLSQGISSAGCAENVSASKKG